MSTGKPGYDTPVGVFRAYHYSEDHISSQYPRGEYPWQADGGGEMPHAVFFSKGIAVHGGIVTHARASHGCVRVSLHAAKFLWDNFYSVGDTTMEIVVVPSMRHLDQMLASR